MALGKLGDKVKETVESVKETAGGMGAASFEKLYEWLDEFNTAVTLLGEFGFVIEKFEIGSGLVPGVTAAIVGSLDDVSTEVVDKAISDHEGQKILATLMKSVRTAKNVRERVDSLPFSDIRILVTLGWPPDISIDFIDRNL